MLTCADPETVGEAALTAVTVTVFAAGIALGGVKIPVVLIVPTVAFPPATPFTCHVTAVLERLLTLALNASVLPNRTWFAPLTVTEGVEDCVLGIVAPEPHPARIPVETNEDTTTQGNK